MRMTRTPERAASRVRAASTSREPIPGIAKMVSVTAEPAAEATKDPAINEANTGSDGLNALLTTSSERLTPIASIDMENGFARFSANALRNTLR